MNEIALSKLRLALKHTQEQIHSHLYTRERLAEQSRLNEFTLKNLDKEQQGIVSAMKILEESK